MDNDTDIPPRVIASMKFIDTCNTLTEPCCWGRPGRILTKHEARVHNAALEVLRMYFIGEMDYQDTPENDNHNSSSTESKSPSLPPAI